jgi:hypothetical protein
MQVRVSGAPTITVGLSGSGEAQPDRRDVDCRVVEDIFVNLGCIAEVAQRVGCVSLAQRCGLADKAFGIFQAGKPPAGRLEPP